MHFFVVMMINDMVRKTLLINRVTKILLCSPVLSVLALMGMPYPDLLASLGFIGACSSMAVGAATFNRYSEGGALYRYNAGKASIDVFRRDKSFLDRMEVVAEKTTKFHIEPARTTTTTIEHVSGYVFSSDTKTTPSHLVIDGSELTGIYHISLPYQKASRDDYGVTITRINFVGPLADKAEAYGWGRTVQLYSYSQCVKMVEWLSAE